MQKWDAKTNKHINLELLKITFDSGIIPYNVTLFDNILLKVNYYIPNPLFCKKCHNYGHTLNHCRSTINRCKICAKIYEGEHVCDNVIACKSCGIGHVSNFFKCKERYRQKQIREHMILNKSSFNEAKQHLFGNRNIPKQSDFSNSLNNTQAWNGNNLFNTDDRKIKILTNVVNELKNQIKKRDDFFKDIAEYLNNKDNTNETAIDDLKIKLANFT